MIPLIIIIALVVAGIALLLIQNRMERDAFDKIMTDIDTSDWMDFDCHSLAHPEDSAVSSRHVKPKKKATKKRVTIRKKQVKNGKVPKVRKPR